MLSKLKNANWKLIFDKVGTILVDRRFWLKFVFPTVFALGLFPQLADANAEQLTDQAIGWVKLIVEVVIPVLSAYLLGVDWTKRPPSGLEFKELSSELNAKLRELGIK